MSRPGMFVTVRNRRGVVTGFEPCDGGQDAVGRDSGAPAPMAARSPCAA
jgi:hypothetical protein